MKVILPFLFLMMITCWAFSQRAVVSADKMNVFYVGIDNPFSIAVPGYNSNDLIVTCNKGSIKGSNSKYIYHIGFIGTVIIYMLQLKKRVCCF